MAGYCSTPFMSAPYHDEGGSAQGSLYFQVLKKTNPLANIVQGAMDDNLGIQGKYLDQAYTSGQELLVDSFPDTAGGGMQTNWFNFLGVYTTAEALYIMGQLVQKRGRLSTTFYQNFATTWGYATNVFAHLQFIVQDQHPPATQLPAQIWDATEIYTWTIQVVGLSPSDSPQYRQLFANAVNALKPAFTNVNITYP